MAEPVFRLPPDAFPPPPPPPRIVSSDGTRWLPPLLFCICAAGLLIVGILIGQGLRS
jgi:hypothetical protein